MLLKFTVPDICFNTVHVLIDPISTKLSCHPWEKKTTHLILIVMQVCIEIAPALSSVYAITRIDS